MLTSFCSDPKEMAKEFTEEGKRTQKERLLLTAAVAAGREKINAGYEVSDILK